MKCAGKKIGASEWTRTIDPHHVKVVLQPTELQTQDGAFNWTRTNDPHHVKVVL